MITNPERLKFMRLVKAEYEPPKILFFGTEYYGEMMLENGARLGQDGFGWEWDGKKLVKFHHKGDVRICENVEIGANTCIDRATLEGEATEIGFGTKIDNLVHVAHNCKIGQHNLICAGVVLCGGVETGDRVYIGVGAVIKQHLKIGNDVTIGMGAVVTHDVPDGVTVIGNPARIYENTNS